MGYRDVEILRDKNGNPISQYFDVVAQDFKPLTKDNYPKRQENNDRATVERLNDIENKLDSVIENGAVNTQLSGSNVEDGILVKQKNGVIPIQEKIGVIPSNSSKMILINLLEEEGLINNISLVGRNNTKRRIEIDIREGYLQTSGAWNTSLAFKKVVFEESESTEILTDRQQTLSQCIYIYVTNKSDADIELLSLGVMLWS